MLKVSSAGRLSICIVVGSRRDAWLRVTARDCTSWTKNGREKKPTQTLWEPANSSTPAAPVSALNLLLVSFHTTIPSNIPDIIIISSFRIPLPFPSTPIKVTSHHRPCISTPPQPAVNELTTWPAPLFQSTSVQHLHVQQLARREVSRFYFGI